LILLDTQILIWADSKPDRLGSKARRLIEAASTRLQLTLSPVTFFETALLVQARRVKLGDGIGPWRAILLDRGFRELPVDGAIAIRASELQLGTADPFDRIIVATAEIHNCELMTADAAILDWRGRLRRIDARE